MIIDQDKVVSLSYQLVVGGKIVDQSTEGHPLTFLFGHGNLIPGFEKNVKGKKVGDKYDFTVSPEEGYGVIDENAVVEIDKQIFVQNGELIPELKMDAMLPMHDQHGNRMDGKVVHIGLDKVKMDFNHPLAGQELNFSGTITEVREALPEEISHGHVHGPGGHHH